MVRKYGSRVASHLLYDELNGSLTSLSNGKTETPPLRTMMKPYRSMPMWIGRET